MLRSAAMDANQVESESVTSDRKEKRDWERERERHTEREALVEMEENIMAPREETEEDNKKRMGERLESLER